MEGKVIHLMRNSGFGGRLAHVCRLRYAGSIDNMKFAIYKYSKDDYDPKEWFFPGSEFVDGTLEGAMLAGLEAYPIGW